MRTDAGIEGAWRYPETLRLVTEALEQLPPQAPTPAEISARRPELRQVHKTIKAISDDIEAFHFNRAVARIHELTNKAASSARARPIWSCGGLRSLRDRAPMMPHLAEELCISWREGLASSPGLKPIQRDPDDMVVIASR